MEDEDRYLAELWRDGVLVASMPAGVTKIDGGTSLSVPMTIGAQTGDTIRFVKEGTPLRFALRPLEVILGSRSEAYSMWAEPLRIADSGEDGHARYRQNERGVLPPVRYWTGQTCKHPQSPVAWLMPDGAYVCHCAELLAVTERGEVELLFPPNPMIEHPDGEVVTCENCGCYVLVLNP